MKMGRSNNYGIEEFKDNWNKKITWDEVTEEDLEDCYIEYSYIYDIDT